MSDKSSVSAVMFVYNEAEYIVEQIDSILGQTVIPDKIIIVDDQSTDNTKEIIDTYIAHHGNRIDYYYNPKKGKVNALALGLSKLTTDYYFVCAGDDIMSDVFVETNLAILEHDSYLYVYNSYIRFYAPYHRIALPAKEAQLTKVTFRDLLRSNSVGGGIFAKTEILKFLLPINEQLPFEDWYLALKLASKYGYCIKNEVPTILYRQHVQSDSSNLHYTRERFNKLITRDLQLFNLMIEDAYFNEKEKQQFRNKILFLENMLQYHPVKALKVFFNKQFYMQDRLKSLIYPIIKKSKYKI